MKHKDLHGKSIRESFEEFHKNNPKVYDLFEDLCFTAINKGITKLSAYLIIERIRWEFFISTTQSNFKINNSFRPFYAREFIKNHPEHGSKFGFRKLRSEDVE